MQWGFLIAFAVGALFGWVWRSYQFFRDHDCADPSHKYLEE